MTYTTPGGKVYPQYIEMLHETHLMIAGTTGSGKSTLIHALIHTATAGHLPGEIPQSVQFILIDPKQEVLTRFRNLPHTIRYTNTLDGALSALQLGEQIRARRQASIAGKPDADWIDDIPDFGDLYIIVDEFGDLVDPSGQVSKEDKAKCKQIDGLITKIGRLGRSAHVHLILATQSPDRQTMKAHIVQNMTATVGLRCRELIESRQAIGGDLTKKWPLTTLPKCGTGVYKAGDGTAEWIELPMIPLEEQAERVKWWADQKPAPAPRKGFLHRLFGAAATTWEDDKQCIKQLQQYGTTTQGVRLILHSAQAMRATGRR